MKNVLLRAPLLTNSGYGVHSRQIFEWLERKKEINLQKDDKIDKKVFHRRYYVLHREDTMSIYTYRINDPI